MFFSDPRTLSSSWPHAYPAWMADFWDISLCCRFLPLSSPGPGLDLWITSLMNVGLCCLHDVVQKKEWKSWVWNIYNFMELGGQWSGYGTAKRSTPIRSHSLAIGDSSAPAPAALLSFSWSLATQICPLTEGSDLGVDSLPLWSLKQNDFFPQKEHHKCNLNALLRGVQCSSTRRPAF